MRLEGLLIFYETVKEGSFSAAARKLFLTQPTISVAIKQLEMTYGQPLLTRKPRGVLELTPLGQQVYELVAQINSQIEQLKTLRQEYSTQGNSEIVIECDTVAGTYLISLVLAKFQENHPGIQFAIKQTASSSIESVSNGNCDLALVLEVNNVEPCYMPTLEFINLWEDQFEIIVSPEHSLAGLNISRNQLLKLSFIVAPKHSPSRLILDKTLKTQIDGAINSLIELNYPEAIKQNVLLLNKPGIVLRSMVECSLHEHRLSKVFTDLDLRCRHVLTFHKNCKKEELIQLFIKFLRAQSLSNVRIL